MIESFMITELLTTIFKLTAEATTLNVHLLKNILDGHESSHGSFENYKMK